MSSDIFEMFDTAGTGVVIPSNGWNDFIGVLDNELGHLLESTQMQGVISGWTITEGDDLTVQAGEGWVDGAHCITAADQAITGVTVGDTLYHIFAVKKVADPNRASASYVAEEVNFVATSDGSEPAGDSILLAYGTSENAAPPTHFQVGTTNNSPNRKVETTDTKDRVTLRPLIDEIANRFYEQFTEYVGVGLLPATDPAELFSDISMGAAYIRGYRVSKLMETTHTYTASKDTYVDLDKTGKFTFVETVIDAGAPAVSTDSIRLAKVVTDVDNITSVVDLRVLGPVGLGDATDGSVAGQLDAKFQVFTTAAADTEFVIPHQLGRVPVGYLVVAKDIAGDVYTSTGGTAWNATNIYLKCTVATVTITVMVF